MDEKSERTTNGGVEASPLSSVSIRGVCMKTKLADIPDCGKTIDFNHHDLTDNIAIFTAHALFCCCSRVVSGRRTFPRVNLRQALTSYLLVH